MNPKQIEWECVQWITCRTETGDGLLWTSR